MNDYTFEHRETGDRFTLTAASEDEAWSSLGRESVWLLLEIDGQPVEDDPDATLTADGWGFR